MPSIIFGVVGNLRDETNASIATNVDVDEGWLSKQFVGPRNWTIVTFGTLVESLKGTAEYKRLCCGRFDR